MSKRKTIIELQNKPENKAVRRLFDKPKTVDYAPLSAKFSETEETNIENQKADAVGDLQKPEIKTRMEMQTAKKTEGISQIVKADKKTETLKSNQSVAASRITLGGQRQQSETASINQSVVSSKREAQTATERLRIFQASTPITRTVTKFQKAAIVVRSQNGKQLVELLWRDQMNEKTRDIWDYLVVRFEEAAEKLNIMEISLRKRDILEQSGVKSDRTFISAVYTLEDMGLIEVKRLSGNKEGNIYILTDEGREEIDGYNKQNPANK